MLELHSIVTPLPCTVFEESMQVDSMAVGRDPVFLPPGAVGIAGQGMKRGSDLTQERPLCMRKELGFRRWRGGCSKLTCFSSVFLVSWEVKAKE